ncbi:MAG: TIGR01777 family oxidoreductase [Planctomycetia bacterium]|nr:TIGR01777 family oxidoreductase [Planctomycetia bacterium]
MKTRQFTHSSQVAASAEETFAWHARPGAFQRLTPPWERVEAIDQKGTIRDGDRLTIRLKIGPVWQQWIAEHVDYIEGRQFCDRQVAGPFAEWEHLHQFTPEGSGHCRLVDRIEYALPMGAVSNLVAGRAVERKLRRNFKYRHRITSDDIAAHHRFAGRAPLRVLLSGSNGMVGAALLPMLTSGGHTVLRLARAASSRGGIRWDPEAGEIDPSSLEGFDAVVHLAGENIASSRWSDAQKKKILESRTLGTRLLAETLAKLKNPPKVFLCASAVGFYGDRGDEQCDESSPRGQGFLADVCAAWEAATEPARDAGIRTVNLRFGVILSGSGGALAKMLPPFLVGAGGRIGSGKQWMSWIALDDVIGAIHHALFTESIAGPTNVVSPHPVTNREFTRVLGRVLRRPTIFPLPAFAARLALGQMADELLLAGQRVLPRRLQASDYPFRFAELEPALRHLLGRA